jgi:hypothetical protein
MHFLDKDYYSLPKDESAFQNHYDEDYSCFSKYFAMFSSFGYLIHAKKKLKSNEGLNKRGLDDSDLKNIKYEQSS